YIASTFWPLVLIYFGVKGLVTTRGMSTAWIGNVFIVLLGTLFLGRNLDFIDITFSDFFKYVIPVLLIVFGFQMIFKSNNRHGKDWKKSEYNGESYKYEYKYEYKPEHPDTFKTSSGKWNEPVDQASAQQAEPNMGGSPQ